MFSTPDGANVAPTPESSQPVAGSGHLLNQVVDTTVALEPGVWEVTAVTGSVVLGWATTATAANIGFVCPSGQSILIVVPATQAHIHYRCLADYTVAYLRKVKEAANTTLTLTPPAPSADPEPMNIDPGVAQVVKDTTYTINSVPLVGTFDEAARNTDPTEAKVLVGTSYTIGNVAKVGTLPAGVAYTPVASLIDLVKVADDLNGLYLQTDDIDAAYTNPATKPGAWSAGTYAANTWKTHTVGAVERTYFSLKSTSAEPTAVTTADWRMCWITAEGWLPIGNYPSVFRGHYHGADYHIDGLFINRDGSAAANYQGLFGKFDGILTNIVLDGGSITGIQYVGSLVAWGDGYVANCSSTADVTGDGTYYDAGLESDVYPDDIGGLIGTTPSGLVEDCSYNGDVIATKNGGGFCGCASGALFTRCNSSGTVTVAGLQPGDGHYAGGFAGQSYGILTDCHSHSVVEGEENVGGLVGYCMAGSMSGCYATGAVTGVTNVGGLLGNGSVSLTDCYATGEVISTGDTTGGLVGVVEGGPILRCYATGAVTGVNYVGGLIGDANCAISECYATGDVTGSDDFAGGFIARSYVSIADCFATGDVTGVDTVAGFIASVANSGFSTVDDCYSTGAVAGTSHSGFCHVNDGTVTTCYWDTTTSGQNHSTAGTGFATADMVYDYADADPQPPANAAAAYYEWDFTTVWQHGATGNYPTLRGI